MPASFAGERLDVLKLPMTVTARRLSVVSATSTPRRRLIRGVAQSRLTLSSKMNSKHLLRSAGVLCLVTCAAHLAGTLMKIPSEQVEMLKTVATMKQTMIPMPVGSARSYMDILDGNNFCTSILLMLCGLELFIAAMHPEEGGARSVVTVVALCLAGFAIISAIYFFPVPAVLTGLASAFALLAQCKVSQS